MKRLVVSDNSNYFAGLEKLLAAADDDEQLFKSIVNAPFYDTLSAGVLGLGIVVLLLVNKAAKTVDRVALSKTEQAEGAVKMSVKPFKEIVIPADYADNIIVKAINTGNPQKTADWQYLFNPALTPEEARLNQAGAGIGCSIVYPLKARNGGAMIFSYFLMPDEIDDDHHKFMSTYSSLVSKTL